MSKTSDIRTPALVPTIEVERVQQLIHIVRGERVILDRDIAALYGVETKNLKRQVKRNISRFPSDFMVELTREEYNSLRCQNGTIENGKGEHSKYLPFAFTENGVAMLSSVLTSEVAVQVNIQIMRAFTMLRRAVYTLNEAMLRQDKLELEVENLRNYVEEILRDQNDTNDYICAQMNAISDSLSELATKVDDITSKPKPAPRNPIGFEAAAKRYEEEAKKSNNN